MTGCRVRFALTMLALCVAPSRVLAQDDRPALSEVPQGFGVNIHFTQPGPGEVAALAGSGFGIVRMDVQRRIAERPGGLFDFSAYDVLVGSLAQAGARPLLILWSGETTPENQAVAPRTEEARAAMARFASAIAYQYRDSGVLWEIWNEPNNDHFWQPRPDPIEYTALAVAMARAIHQADPDAVVLGPSGGSLPWSFMEATFQAGLLGEIDAVSVHPYRLGPPESVVRDYDRLRGLIARYAPQGKADMPIICSEWGYSTAVGQFSEVKQAQYLMREYLVNLACGVNVTIFYDWRDDGPDPRNPQHRFGTVRTDLSPKPAYHAARDLANRLRGFTFRHRLATRSANEWRLLFENAQTGALALVSWSAGPRGGGASSVPSVQTFAAEDPNVLPLRRLASIRSRPGAIGEPPHGVAALPIELVNREDQPARIELELGDRRSRRGETFEVVPRGASARLVAMPPGRSSRSVAVRYRWNGLALPAVVPLSVVRAGR